MYVVTSMPFVSRTRATFRSAEFGFFGVTVKTRVQTPRFCGAPRSAGVFVFTFGVARPLRTSWFAVGTRYSYWRSVDFLTQKGRRATRHPPTGRGMVANRLLKRP